MDLHLEVLLFELLRERPAALTLILLVKLHLLLLKLLRGSDIEVVNYVGDVGHAIRRVWVCGILRRVWLRLRLAFDIVQVLEVRLDGRHVTILAGSRFGPIDETRADLLL